MITAGSEAQFVNEGEALNEFGQVFEDGLFLANHTEETHLFSFAQILDGMGWVMLCDEVIPERAIGPAVVLGEIDSVGLAEADFVENFAKSALMPWLAVDNNAIHVENDRAESFLQGAVYKPDGGKGQIRFSRRCKRLLARQTKSNRQRLAKGSLRLY